MENFKKGKLITIIQEFLNTGNKYQINGIDAGKTIFFARRQQYQYEPIPKGNYTITQEDNNQYLNITNSDYLGTIESIQIGIEFASISSSYDVDFNVDINILKDKYNQLVIDVQNLFEYTKKNLMIADALDVAVVLPQLDKDEVWVRTENGYRGLNIGSLEANIQNLIDQFKALVVKSEKDIEEQTTQSIEDIKATTTEEVEKGKQALIDKTNEEIGVITDLADDKIQEITQEGDKQKGLVTQQGDIEIERINSTGLDGKVSKTGDTMSGDLEMSDGKRFIGAHNFGYMCKDKSGVPDYALYINAYDKLSLGFDNKRGISFQTTDLTCLDGQVWHEGNFTPPIDTIETLKTLDLKQGQVVEVLGYYAKDDGATHKRVIAQADDGSGVQLNNGLWANIVHNGEVNVSWLGCKKNDDSFAEKNSELVNKILSKEESSVFIPSGTWAFKQIKFNSFCSIRGFGKGMTFIKQSGQIDNIGQSIFKNHSFLQAIETKNSDFNANAFSIIKDMTIKGIKQSNINGIGFSGTENDVKNSSEYNDQHFLIENVEVREFYNGIYVGEYYKENRINKVLSRYNLNSGIIYKGTDYFINNTTCETNDNNGFEIYGGEARVEFSKAFYNKNSGFLVKSTSTMNNISSQENFEYGICIETSNQEIIISNLFVGSNGISGGAPAEIKANSAAIIVKGNNNKIKIIANSSDFRSDIDNKPVSYSNYFLKIEGKYNSITGNLNTKLKFNNLLDIRNNFLNFYINEQNIIKEWTQNEFDFDGSEMKIAEIFIDSVDNTRFVGCFGYIDIINPLSIDSTDKTSNAFNKVAISLSHTYERKFKIQINEKEIEDSNLKNKIKLYGKTNSDGSANLIMTFKTGWSYSTLVANLYNYDASYYFIPNFWRTKFVNDGTYQELEIKYTEQQPVQIQQLNTPHMATKMQQEGVYDDFISYMDEKTLYDKQQEKLERDKQVAYEEELKQNPELTYEEFLQNETEVDRMMLPVETKEPQPSERLKEFMDKWL